MKKHFQAIVPGNQSPADDLFDMGMAMSHQKKCDCECCKNQLAEITNTYRASIVTLAEAWYDLHKQPVGIGTVFEGLLHEWDEYKCAEACGLEYKNEAEAA